MNKKLLSANFLSIGYPVGIIDGKFQIFTQKGICYLGREEYLIWNMCRSNKVYSDMRKASNLDEKQLSQCILKMVKNKVLFMNNNLSESNFQKEIIPVRQGMGLGESDEGYIILQGTEQISISTEAYLLWLFCDGTMNINKIVTNLKKYGGYDFDSKSIISSLNELTARNLLFLLG